MKSFPNTQPRQYRRRRARRPQEEQSSWENDEGISQSPPPFQFYNQQEQFSQNYNWGNIQTIDTAENFAGTENTAAIQTKKSNASTTTSNAPIQKAPPKTGTPSTDTTNTAGGNNASTTTDKKSTDQPAKAGNQSTSVEDIPDKVLKRKYPILDVKLREWPMKVGKISLGLKVSMSRGKTLGTTKQKGMIPKFEAGSAEYNPILGKYALKIGSTSADFADLGCGIKAKIGFDAVKIEKGKVSVSNVGVTGYGKYNKETFETYKNCALIQKLTSNNQNIPLLMAAGWSLEIEIKGDISIDPEELAKVLKLRQLQKQMQNLGKQADDTAKKLKENKQRLADRKKEFERKQKQKAQRQARKGKRYKPKKWKNSKSYKDLMRNQKQLTGQADDIAKKMAQHTDDIAKVGKGMKSPWGRKLAEKSLGWAKSFSTKVLGRLVVVLAVLDTVVTVAKIIKYWDQIQLKWPWESGPSLSDAPLFGDTPEGGNPASDNKQNPQGQGGGSSTKGDPTGKSKTDGKGGNTKGGNSKGGNSKGGNSKGGNSKGGEGKSDKQGDGKQPAGGEGKTDTKGKSSSGLSDSSKKKIKSAPGPVRALVEAMIKGKNGPKVKDEHIDSILSRIPKDLTPEQSQELQGRLADASGKTIEEILQHLEKAVKAVRGGKKETATEPSGDKKKPDVAKDDKDKKPKQGEKKGTTEPKKEDKKKPPTAVGPDKSKFHFYVYEKVFSKDEKGVFSINQDELKKLKKEGMNYTDKSGSLNVGVDSISPHIEEVTGEGGKKHQKLSLTTNLKVTKIPEKAPSNYKYKVGDPLVQSTSYLYFAKENKFRELKGKKLGDFIAFKDDKLVLKPGVAGKIQDFGTYQGLLEVKDKGGNRYDIIATPKAPLNPGTAIIVDGKLVPLEVDKPVRVATVDLNQKAAQPKMNKNRSSVGPFQLKNSPSKTTTSFAPYRLRQ